jgi:hypothetical protein
MMNELEMISKFELDFWKDNETNRYLRSIILGIQ